MSRLKSNILANAAGKSWTALLTLIAIPIQVRIIGPEAYGLLSFISALQIVISILDLGLSATITREMAMDASEGKQESRRLLSTLHSLYWIVSAVLVLGSLGAAPLLASHWLKLRDIPEATAISTLRIAGMSVALRWPIALYSGMLAGLQRMDISNLLDAISATLRVGGGLVVLWITRSFLALVWWTLLIAMLEALAYAIVAPRYLPSKSLAFSLAMAPLRKVWKFALGMNAVSFLSLLFIQMDRLILGRLFSVEALGYYSIAYNASAMLAGIPRIINLALFPSLSEDFARSDLRQINYRYETASRYIAWLLAAPAAIMIFFGSELLGYAVSEPARLYAAQPLAILALAFLINQLLTPGYTLSISAGMPRIPNLINLFLLPVYLPALYFLTAHHGPSGAAFAFLGLNAVYLIALLPWIHRVILKTSSVLYVLRIMLPPLLGGAICFGLAKIGLLWFHASGMMPAAGAFVGGLLTYLIVAGLVLRRQVMRHIAGILE